VGAAWVRHEVGDPREQGLSEFLAMGGYAAYVWSAFGFALVVLLGLLGQSWRAAHQREAELAQLRELVRAGRARPARAQAIRQAQEPTSARPVTGAK
jgi:heme exporter protein D